MSDKFWSKEQLTAIRKTRGQNVTHIRITAPGGKTAIVDWADKDTLEGVCGVIDIGRLRKKEKGSGMRFSKVAGIVKPEAPVTPPSDPHAKKKLAKEKKASTNTVKLGKESKGQSKCGFIDDLLEEGVHTLPAILDMVVKRFPDTDPEKTMKTIRCRPCHMRKAGRTPSWVK